MNIELVEQHGDRLCFWQGYPYSGGTGFFPFPHRLVAGSKDVKALLSYRSCYRAPEITFELTKKLFDGNRNMAREHFVCCANTYHLGIASRIEFVHLWPASGKYTVFASDDDVTFLHEVLALDALDGNSYILDLTGAQLGFRDSLTPLDEYLHKLGARIVKIQHHDFALAQFKRNLHQHSQCVTVTMQHEMYKSLNYAVEEFEDQMQVSLPVMLRFQEWQFENYASFLASCMRLGLETTFKSRVKAGHPGVSVDESALSIVELRCLLPLKLKDDTGSGVFRQWKREHEAHARARANAPSMWSKLSAWLGRLFFPLKKQE